MNNLFWALLILFLALRWREGKAAGLAPVHHNLLQVVLAWLALFSAGLGLAANSLSLRW